MRHVFSVAAAISLLCAPALAAQPSYSLTEIIPGSSQSFSRGINKKNLMLVNGTFAGEAAGLVCDTTFACLPVPSPEGSKSPYANVSYITDNGSLIVGTAPRNGDVSHAIVYDGIQSIDLGTLRDPDCPKCKLDSWPSGVNKAGQVIGGTYLSDHVTERSFIWQAGVMTDIGTLPGSKGTSVSAINEHGHVVGGSRTPDNGFTPIIFRNGKIKAIPLPLGVPYGAAVDINDQGQILINAGTGGANAMYVYDHGTYTQIQLGAQFQAGPWVSRLNNHGVILGFYSDARSGHTHPFVFDGIDAIDLNDCLTGNDRNDYEVYAAFGLNDQGRIMATAQHRATHTTRAVLLTPIAN